MPHTQLLLASHLAHHWQPATPALSSLGLFWVGLVNVAVLAAFFGAASRRVGPGPSARATERRATRVTGRRHAPDESAGSLLASDVERDRAVEVVCAGVAEGRLSFDEGSDRVEKALTARTLADLGAALDGLPVAAPAPRTRRSGQPVAAVLAVAAAVTVQLLFATWVAWPAAAAVLLILAVRQPPEPGSGALRLEAAAARERRGPDEDTGKAEGGG